MSYNKPYLENYPDENGFFGKFGGSYVPPNIQEQMDIISREYQRIKNDPEYLETLDKIRNEYQGRPTPISHAKRLSDYLGGAQIYLKREDLNHMGAHKLNHCLAEALIAKQLGKKKIICETGAGQHGVGLATAAAFFGLDCDVYMGEIDMIKEAPNVSRMRILGAQVIPASHGLKSLKEAVDDAFTAYVSTADETMYCIGSVVGPHPFPAMVRDMQSVVGKEAKEQFASRPETGDLPDHVVACCGGGSNAAGIFSAFIDDESVKLYAVEPCGTGESTIGKHAASISYGSEGIMHGFNSIMLKDENNEPAPVHSIASGLDYPSVGPEHAFWSSIGRTEKSAGATDNEAVEAFFMLSKLEGIIPALESSHAIAYAIKLARTLPKDQTILVNLSGRGDKDLDYVIEKYPEMVDKKFV
ncbi:Tryptophan synthase [Komagataella phaffii CBS 7435]|uniref:Tryptophan synthase n=2 Tax=Komagataella phaffii TaxID=460519 RepID=C4R547_KOMPG|nr:Tryptophan synthase involved in tryptophan biosynthesis [Komagataella phaffii GS115]AOA64143.1 GQ67_03719T0 [Komagataella phaffii]CAH2449543.1 Tryptophan synthase [Komagataella phaffii CBS 7435]AOA69323.1 GQ68_03691T0 [Komagataella phaffii GS115]CAY70683.1 Tryptophan synthase involved in tryptophan biosynthesis [Komagataella phaffii GS115]CCA39525.1 Tryptophan synthase [Komagataella phaffii CBS 7435]